MKSFSWGRARRPAGVHDGARRRATAAAPRSVSVKVSPFEAPDARGTTHALAIPDVVLGPDLAQVTTNLGVQVADAPGCFRAG